MSNTERITTSVDGRRVTILLDVVAEKGGLIIGERLDSRGMIWEKGGVQQTHIIDASTVTGRKRVEMDFGTGKLAPCDSLSDGHRACIARLYK
jgi:hypothetical protein